MREGQPARQSAAARARALLQEAIALRSAGRTAAAAAKVDAALAIESDNADAVHLAAILAHDKGDSVAALAHVDRALAMRPGRAAFHRSRGIIAAALGRIDDAVASLGVVAAEAPADVELARSLAALLVRAGRERDAAAVIARAAEAGRDGDLCFEAGALLQSAKETKAACLAYRRAIEMKPAHLRALVNLATLLAESGEREEARTLFARALRLQVAPKDGAVLATSYANFLVEDGRREEAREFYVAAVHLQPENAQYRLKLGAYLSAQADDSNLGNWHIVRALELDPTIVEDLTVEGLANVLLVLLYVEVDAQRNRALAERWAAMTAPDPAPPASDARVPEPLASAGGRRLRVGYCSSDLRSHSVANFLLPLLEHHDRSAVELFAYANVDRPDAVTERMRALFDHWIDATAIADDRQLANRMRSDRLDVLVDLNGQTLGNRLGAFRHRPAPVQITWLGYPGTTGLDCFDARITDARADPPGMTEAHFCEQLERIEPAFLAYRPLTPPPASPDAPPAATNGFVTFGCFNNAVKIARRAWRLWAPLFRAEPQARLVLKSFQYADPLIADDVRRLASLEGFPVDRLSLAPAVASVSEHLASYGRIDIALDSFPYHGTTTTLEALAMGVPVVTLAGPTHASRVGVSILGQIGLDGLVAQNDGAYVAACRRLAADLPGLARWRRELPERLARSSLCDHRGFAGRLEALYRRLWHAKCSSVSATAPDPVSASG